MYNNNLLFLTDKSYFKTICIADNEIGDTKNKG